MKFTIRAIEPDDVAHAFELRLLALSESADAYGTSYAEEVNRDDAWVRARYAHTPEQVVMGAFDEGGHLIGIGFFSRGDRIKTRHKGNLQGIYVRLEARGHGVGRAITEALVAHARTLDGLEVLHLGVITSNTQAIRLYESLGFRSFSLEPHCHKIGDRYNDLSMMALFLD